MIISYGDSDHPRKLLKDLKRKKRQMKLALRGNFIGFTDTEKDHIETLSHGEIQDMIREYDKRIKKIKKDLCSQGKLVLSNERNARRTASPLIHRMGLFYPA